MPTISFPKTADTLMCGPWKFSRETGAEIDEDLDWDGFTATGSFLKIESENP